MTDLVTEYPNLVWSINFG